MQKQKQNNNKQIFKQKNCLRSQFMRVDVELFYEVSFEWVHRCKEHLIIPILLMNISAPKNFIAEGLYVLCIYCTMIAYNTLNLVLLNLQQKFYYEPPIHLLVTRSHLS